MSDSSQKKDPLSLMKSIWALPSYGFIHSEDKSQVLKAKGLGNWIDRDEVLDIVERAQFEIDELRSGMGLLMVPDGFHIKMDGNDIRIAYGDLGPDGEIKLGDTKSVSAWLGPNPKVPEMILLRKLVEVLIASPKTPEKRTPFAYSCPHKCGCLWTDNQDGTMSLFGPNSQACGVCEPIPLSDLIPVYTDV